MCQLFLLLVRSSDNSVLMKHPLICHSPRLILYKLIFACKNLQSAITRQPRPGHESRISPVPACSCFALAAPAQRLESQAKLSAAQSLVMQTGCCRLCRLATNCHPSVSQDPGHVNPVLSCHITSTQSQSKYQHNWSKLLQGRETTAHAHNWLKHCITLFLANPTNFLQQPAKSKLGFHDIPELYSFRIYPSLFTNSDCCTIDPCHFCTLSLCHTDHGQPLVTEEERGCRPRPRPEPPALPDLVSPPAANTAGSKARKILKWRLVIGSQS